jgi:hypothetical protein
MSSCQALSCLAAAVGGGTFLGDVKPPGLDILWTFDCVDTLTWGKSFLLGDAYPMAEPSWQLGVYPRSSYCVGR